MSKMYAILLNIAESRLVREVNISTYDKCYCCRFVSLFGHLQLYILIELTTPPNLASVLECVMGSSF